MRASPATAKEFINAVTIRLFAIISYQIIMLYESFKLSGVLLIEIHVNY